MRICRFIESSGRESLKIETSLSRKRQMLFMRVECVQFSCLQTTGERINSFPLVLETLAERAEKINKNKSSVWCLGWKPASHICTSSINTAFLPENFKFCNRESKIIAQNVKKRQKFYFYNKNWYLTRMNTVKLLRKVKSARRKFRRWPSRYWSRFWAPERGFKAKYALETRWFFQKQIS